MNNFTAVVNLCRDPEALTLGSNEVMKLRLADNTPGKNNETRYFGAIVSGRDVETATRLGSGDQILVTGQLVQQEYKAKKDGKGVKKGQTVKTDEMPFAKILQVIKSKTFFADTTEPAGVSDANPVANTQNPDDGADDPLADVY